MHVQKKNLGTSDNENCNTYRILYVVLKNIFQSLLIKALTKLSDWDIILRPKRLIVQRYEPYTVIIAAAADRTEYYVLCDHGTIWKGYDEV